ncbi:MAG: FAD-dependent oxidoreductase [Bradymonadales bacterium]|nr:FAD-dependent oxidoreductase [Bradymonadales bacterium]
MTTVKSWKCEVCGFIHHGLEPPDTCPVCGVGQEMFSLLEIVALPPAPSFGASWRCAICGFTHHGASPPELCPRCGAKRELFEPYDEGTGVAADPMEGQSLVVAGAGVAGLTAAEQARKMAPGLQILLVGREEGLPYFRINLTRYLAGEIDRDDLPMQPMDWFEKNRIELVRGDIGEIDRHGRGIHLRDGRVLAYDRLILATGAHAFMPPITGATREGVLVHRSLQDSDRIMARAKAGQRCVCIGGGLLGLETAGALSKRGLEVTVLEGFDWLLPRQLAQPAGRLLESHLEELGIAVHCGVEVEEIAGDEMVRGVRLENGQLLDADLVVVAAGIRPNSFLARRSGLAVNLGVIVDDRMATSDPTIFAAGDVAEHRGTLYGIWPAAYAQGLVAGVNAVGGAAQFERFLPSTRLKVLEVDLFSIGQFQPEDASYTVVEESEEGVYRRFVCRDGTMVGANLYGDTGLAGSVKEAIESRAHFDHMPPLLQEVNGLARWGASS